MKMAGVDSSRIPDNSDTFCTGKDSAFLPFNRCNLPASLLGSLSFQQHPVPLTLDGVATLHRSLFTHLQAMPDAAARAHRFIVLSVRIGVVAFPTIALDVVSRRECAG